MTDEQQPNLFERFEEEERQPDAPHLSPYAPPPASPAVPAPSASSVSEPVAAAPTVNDQAEPPREESEQSALFRREEWWEAHWQGMPEFVQHDLHPWKSINIHFESREDMAAFAELVGQRLTRTTQAIWYPELDIHRVAHLRYVSDEPTADEQKAIENGRLEIEEE